MEPAQCTDLLASITRRIAAGWIVYGAGTAHRPTISGAKALIHYLLPDASIEFTKA